MLFISLTFILDELEPIKDIEIDEENQMEDLDYEEPERDMCGPRIDPREDLFEDNDDFSQEL